MSQNGTEQQTQAPTPPAHDDYPEQKHAGAVGYGPNYQRGVGFGEKFEGMKEEIKGKILRKPDMVEHGRERRTGELKKKEEEADQDETLPGPSADSKPPKTPAKDDTPPTPPSKSPLPSPTQQPVKEDDPTTSTGDKPETAPNNYAFSSAPQTNNPPGPQAQPTLQEPSQRPDDLPDHLAKEKVETERAAAVHPEGTAEAEQSRLGANDEKYKQIDERQ